MCSMNINQRPVIKMYHFRRAYHFPYFCAFLACPSNDEHVKYINIFPQYFAIFDILYDLHFMVMVIPSSML